MFCGNCGSKIETSTKFCGSCGALVQDNTASNSVSQNSSSGGKTLITSKKNLFIIGGGAAVIIIAALVFYIFFYPSTQLSEQIAYYNISMKIPSGYEYTSEYDSNIGGYLDIYNNYEKQSEFLFTSNSNYFYEDIRQELEGFEQDLFHPLGIYDINDIKYEHSNRLNRTVFTANGAIKEENTYVEVVGFVESGAVYFFIFADYDGSAWSNSQMTNAIINSIEFTYGSSW